MPNWSTAKKQQEELKAISDRNNQLDLLVAESTAELTQHPKLNIIPQDVGRVLPNLFNNAFYAVQHKQKTAGANYKPEIKVSSGLKDKFLQIAVWDNGTGIPDAVKDKKVPLSAKKVTLAGKKVRLSAKKVTLAGKKVALSAKKVALSAKKVALAGKKVTLSAKKVTLSGGKVALAGKKVALSAKKMALSAKKVTLAGEKGAAVSKKGGAGGGKRCGCFAVLLVDRRLILSTNPIKIVNQPLICPNHFILLYFSSILKSSAV